MTMGSISKARCPPVGPVHLLNLLIDIAPHVTAVPSVTADIHPSRPEHHIAVMAAKGGCARSPPRCGTQVSQSRLDQRRLGQCVIDPIEESAGFGFQTVRS